MGFLNRFRKVHEEVEVVEGSDGTEESIEVSTVGTSDKSKTNPLSTSSVIRERLAAMNPNRKPPTRRERKKLRKIEATQYSERRVERTGRIQAIMELRQSHMHEYH